MKLDIVAGSQNDEFYTPKYAILPILPYLKPKSVVWCPFDTEESQYVKILKSENHEVYNSHIASEGDFFTLLPPNNCEYVISNPPYSCKTEVLQRLFSLGIPFAMLVGLVGIFESKKRFELFKNNEFEMLLFNLRVSFFDAINASATTKNPPFSSGYICHKILPSKIEFANIDKKNIR